MATNRIGIAQLKALRSTFGSKLRDFAAAVKPTFTVLHTLSHDSDEPNRPTPLYVLDSSFNPPTKAHLHIALSALNSRPGPKRLLLLLATQNADKAAKPAAFEDRLVMMTLLGEAICDELENGVPCIDIGLTKMPYFHEKAKSIERDARYAYTQEKERADAEQIYLIGFDSLVRIFDRKYYPPEKGFAILEPFLGYKHSLRVTMRLDDAWGDNAAQRKYAEDIQMNRRVSEGIKGDWGARIQLVEGEKDGEEVISSTEARRAAKMKNEKLGKLVIPRVREWIETQGLYVEE